MNITIETTPLMNNLRRCKILLSHLDVLDHQSIRPHPNSTYTFDKVGTIARQCETLRACLIHGLKGARPAGQAQASHSQAEVVQVPLFGCLAQRRLCFIQHQGARPNTN